MADLPINYGDTGRVARDKINDSYNALLEQVEWYEPHIVDWIWWIWETNTWVKAEWDHVQMKVEWDYIRYKSDTVSWTTLILLSDLQWPKWDQWETWAKWDQWDKGDTWDKWDTGATITSAAFNWNDIDFTKDDWDIVKLEDAKVELKWEKGDKWDKGNTGDKWDKGDKWDTWATGATGNWIASVTSEKVWKITTVTITETNGDSDTFQISDWEDWQGAGDVLWPSSSTDWNVVLFDWTTWKLIKDSWKTIPTQASDVNALPSSTKYWASLTVAINSSDYKITTTLKDQDWNTLGTAQVIDLPLESVVVWGSYDDQTKKVILTLQNWNTIEFSVADLVAGLQSEITSTNKLDSDLVSDTNQTNKFVTAAEKSTWSGKQDALVNQTNIKSINGNSLLGSGDLTIAAWVTSVNWNTWAVTVNEVPSSWTTGYVLTKTANSYEFAAPSGWIENVTTWTTSTVTWIWAGSEAEYWNITPSSTVLYFTF